MTCLKQPEFSPVTVQGQMTILLALTARLFDPVPVGQMFHFERACARQAPTRTSVSSTTALWAAHFMVL
jgi:F0F1-type ATP synthase alpha subunit